MPTTSTTELEQGSTAKITVSFTDEDSNAVIPTTLYKTVTDLSGNIISARTQITSGLSSSMNIALSATDIPEPADGLGHIVLLLEATYDSDLGNDLPLKDECRIPVNDLIGT
jgi:hypothetical protein